MPRLNTYPRSGYFSSIFSQANPNTVYGSIFENNMDDSSFDKLGKSLIKTVSLPRQALYGSHVAFHVSQQCMGQIAK